MTFELISHHLCPWRPLPCGRNVAFDRIDVNLSIKPNWFKTISPLAKTPLLRIDGQDAIFESAVICEYREEIQGPSLQIVDPLVRARHCG